MVEDEPRTLRSTKATDPLRRAAMWTVYLGVACAALGTCAATSRLGLQMGLLGGTAWWVPEIAGDTLYGLRADKLLRALPDDRFRYAMLLAPGAFYIACGMLLRYRRRPGLGIALLIVTAQLLVVYEAVTYKVTFWIGLGGLFSWWPPIEVLAPGVAMLILLATIGVLLAAVDVPLLKRLGQRGFEPVIMQPPRPQTPTGGSSVADA
jgi:hypothetical protein